MSAKPTELPVPVHRRRGARRRRVCSPTSPRRRAAKIAESAALREATLDRAPRRARAARRRRWRAASARAGGCSRSATAAAPPTPTPPPTCSRVRRSGRALPGGVARRRPRACSPRSPTTSASSSCSPASSSPTRAPATSRSASRRAATRRTCCARSRRPARRGLLTIGLVRLRRRRDGRERRRRPLPRRALRQRPPHPGDAGRRWSSSCGRRCRRGSETNRDAGRTIEHRRAATARRRCFDRIEAFRRRQPRLLDEVVTLAHGAGGKASAALLDAVFLPGVRATTTPREPRPTPRCSRCPSGERLAFTTDSFVVKPLRFPGGSIGHLAVHGTVNDLAMIGRAAARGCRPRSCSRRASRSRRCARSSPTWPRPRPRPASPIVTGDTKVVDRGAADGLYITTAGVGVVPAGRALWRRPGASPATSCSSRARSPTTAWR